MELWQIELQQCIRTVDQLERYFPIQNKERMRAVIANMRLAITPHTLRLIRFDDPTDPIFLMSIPQERELLFSPEELADPIGDDQKLAVPFLTHRYPDRVLVYTTFFCSQFCRFCFRRSKTGEANPGPSARDVDRMLAYLAEHPEVEEVILSGGDPFTLLDGQIEEWLRRIRTVSTIRRIRFHTRTLVNLPSRITDSLVSILRRYQETTRPIYLVTHFNHPTEIASENVAAIAKLVDAGIVVRNQSVLLKGVNDDPMILEQLFKTLVDIRVVPYYLHQLDLAKGTHHFRVPIEQGMNIMKSLQGKVSGIALPRYMLDLPGGKGKIPLTHRFLKKEGSAWRAKTPFGETVVYREP